MRQKPKALFDPFRGRLRVDLDPEDLDRSGLVGQHPGDHLHQTAFSRTIGSDQAINLPLANREIDALDGHVFTVLLLQGSDPNKGLSRGRLY